MLHHAGTIVVGVDGSDCQTAPSAGRSSRPSPSIAPLTLVHAIHAVTPGRMLTPRSTSPDQRDTLRRRVRSPRDRSRHGGGARARTSRSTRYSTSPIPATYCSSCPRTPTWSSSDRVVAARCAASCSAQSARLVRHAYCPVVVHRPGIRTRRNGVLVGVDASPESQPVLEFAYREASLRDLPLTVLHCYWDIQAGRPAPISVDAPSDLSPSGSRSPRRWPAWRRSTPTSTSPRTSHRAPQGALFSSASG